MSKMTEMSPIANNDAVSKETTDYTKPKKSDKICDLREFCKINPILLTSKLFYFFFFGGIGALFPYLTIYFKQLGLGPLRIGLLSGVRPFIGFLSGPLWGAVADRYRKRKIMLMISLCGWIGMLLALGFVPPAKEGECPVAANIVEQFLNGTNATTATENSTTEVSRRSLKSRSFSDLVHVSCGNCQLTNHDGRSRDLYSGRSHVVLRSAKPEFSEEVVAAIDTMNDGEDRSWLYDDDSLQKLFLILMALIMIGEFMQSPASALADTATLKNLGEKNLDKYGHQRVWGAIGLGVASFTVGALLNLTRETFTKCGIELVYSDYHVAFYCFAVLMTGAFIVAATFKFKDDVDDKPSNHNLLSLLKLLSKIQYSSILVVSFFMGICNGVVYGFLFWHLENLGASQLLMGTASFLIYGSEVIMFFLSYPLLMSIGHICVLYLGLVCYALRFLIYSQVTNPWWVLPAEVLQGITFAAVWTALTSFLAFTVPSESFATMQGILHGIYWGLGSGVGNMLGGVLVDSFGAVTTFLAFSMANIVVLGLFFCIQRCCPTPEVKLNGYDELEGDMKEKAEVKSKKSEGAAEKHQVTLPSYPIEAAAAQALPGSDYE